MYAFANLRMKPAAHLNSLAGVSVIGQTESIDPVYWSIWRRPVRVASDAILFYGLSERPVTTVDGFMFI